MKIKRLSWAGVLVQSGDSEIVIDPLGRVPANQDRPLSARLGEALEPFISLEDHQTPAAIAITHIHPDHFDPVSIQEAFGREVPLFLPKESTATVKSLGFTNLIGASPLDTWDIGAFTLTAVHSADGYGTPQIAWIIEADGQKMIHCGDTLWHGEWWKIESLYGPIDVACLPINGAILEVRGLREQSTLPACMTPKEAVEAARILGATLVPIHYGMFNNPPFYSEEDHALKRAEERAEKRGVELCVLEPGEWLGPCGESKITNSNLEEERYADPTSAMGRGTDSD